MKDRYINDLLARQAYITKNMPKKDPFDKGIMRAVQSARKSLAMDEEQEDAALRNSILTFGEEMHKMPKTRGFMSNFAQVGRALSPAIKTHDAYEEEAKDKNMKMLQYAQALRAAEEAKIDNLEYQAYLREHADKVLAEQKNYHQQSLLARFAEAAAKKNGAIPTHNVDAYGLVEGKYVPFMDKKERDPYIKKLAGANLVITHLSDAQSKLDKFNKEHGKELLAAPIIGSTIGKGKGIIGHFSGNKKAIKDANDRAALDQVIGLISTKYEKELKGSILTKNIMDRFESMGLVPKASDSPAVIKNKLAQILKIAKEEQEIAKQSLLNNYHYVPSESSELVNSVGETENNQGMIIMQAPSGMQLKIPANDMQAIKDAEADGFTKVLE